MAPSFSQLSTGTLSGWISGMSTSGLGRRTSMARSSARTGSTPRSFTSSWIKHGVTDDIHLFNEKLREWEDYYNYHRPHGALDGQTPYERLLSKTRAQVSPTS